ncbi:hypothetical protein B0J14DRAFT_603024 [Halenospora varia]|nr:hypothetical protein B0J14DRAFT_603024 [Halenospora varia]
MRNTKRGGICFQYHELGHCSFGSRCKFSHVQLLEDSSSKRPASKQPGKRSKASRRGSPPHADHIDSFFAEHPNFDYDPSAPIWTEFNRMCDDFEWDSGNYEMRAARREFKSAMVQQFNHLYGIDEEDLNSWHNLCKVLKIEPVPEDLTECRERVRETYVNLVDLVDTPRTGAAVKIFPNLEKLQEYTIKTEKYFPKEDAYAGGLLRFLLREILHSYVG